MTDSLDMRRLLSPIGAERFFAEHWQTHMALLPLAADDLAFIRKTIGPLDPARLAGEAREGTQAWLANEFVAHSVFPVDPSNAAQFHDIGATLYFINVPLPALTDSLADFLGAARRKVIASLFFTPAGGGAVPHFDKNENFTIQLTGAKRWQVGETPMVACAPDGYTLDSVITPALAPLLAGARRPPERTVDLEPGTLLYVPRGTVHHTGAGEPSWSLNLSYSPSMWLDLLRVGLQQQLAASPRWRGIVTGAGGDPAARDANRLPELLAELHALLDDPGEAEALTRSFLDRPDG
ncbi:MAG TPA: cupin domain-containing protein [Rhizomicrobium sp.]|jgi:ribosomal protein L16 Arg81 hydroxylase